MKKVSNIGEYNDLVAKYSRKGCLSNDYMQREVADLIIHDALFVDCFKNNAFFFKKQNYGLRIYYYINNIEEFVDFSLYNDLVIEILFRGEIPQQEIYYLEKCGFKKNIIRDQYVAQYSDLKQNLNFIPNIIIEEANNIADVSKACLLFNTTFDKLSGNCISTQEYTDLLTTKKILVARSIDRQEYLGALHQVKRLCVNEIGHVATYPQFQGQGVGNALIDAFIQRNRELDSTRYQLWVQRQNARAISLYERKGFKYNNKSTISLIKL